ncbi:hypothetical protein [Flagellimonas allohymeniacidonis]|uniref:Outer membrane protein beta-barrel domain-containing protein n=1 Tax=Flagellimonas allohymeniacidonis TaxID=2517819 RepID=A0A4Q8QG50_9FLAO|nr:hypothetical protein [Allomuricauda hymeniacidonis]TAI48697.1 hypothetical protein EW142_02540 [Allomuricauda hymeniacidonis]
MKSVFILVLCVLFALTSRSQSPGNDNHRNFPLIISIEFHSLSMPFKNKKLFSNIGIGIGTEVSHNGNRNWVQQFKVSWYGNRNVGGGLLVHSQAVWRPDIVSDAFGELKLGAGYLFAKRPKDSYKPTDKGWKNVGKKGKGMFVLPAGIGFGYDNFDQKTYISPYANYQFIIATKYNKSIPIVPFTLLEVGTRIHFED